MKSRYFIRVQGKHVIDFEAHLMRFEIPFEPLMDYDVGRGTSLYSVQLTSEEELNLRLSVQLEGCMHFTNTVNRFIDQNNDPKYNSL